MRTLLLIFGIVQVSISTTIINDSWIFYRVLFSQTMWKVMTVTIIYKLSILVAFFVC